MSKVIIAINTLTSIDQLAYANHVQMFFRLGRNYPEDQFALFTPRRMTIDRMRNEAFKVAMENGFDYVLFVDDDVLVPFDAYKKLKDRDKDVVAAWTIIRGYPFENMFFKWDEKHTWLIKPKDVEVPEDGLLEVDAIGCSCVLIKVELLKKIPPPYFLTGSNHTEDVFFCMRAKQYVPDCGIYVDLHIKTAHILGANIVTPDNAQFWRTFEELDNPGLVENKDANPDRGEEYLKRIGEA